MRRSERLAELIEIMRDGRLHLARDLALAVEVSERTIYRDIATLMASGVPVEGERGVGYLMREPVFIPQLAFSLVEMEALCLGMSIVQEIADDELRLGAKTLHEKLASVASNRRTATVPWGYGLYEFEKVRRGLEFMPVLRRAVRDRCKLRMDYQSLSETRSSRIIRPLQIEFWGKVWTLTAWCDARSDFRAFRIDRILACEPTGDRFNDEPGKTIEDYLKQVDDAEAEPLENIREN